MLDVLKGGSVSPKLVGMARGVLEAVVLALLGAVAYYLNGDSLSPQIAALAPVALLLIRSLEGYLDHKLDPAVSRANVAAAAEKPAAAAPTDAPKTS